MSYKMNSYLTTALCLTQASGLDPVAGALFAAGLSLLTVALHTE